jgi:hypothetical protein
MPIASLRRARVSDRVLSAFDYACIFGDVETAETLLHLADNIVHRKVARFGGERRTNKTDLRAARAKLARLRTETTENWARRTGPSR